jgi:hypothetical protein
MQPQASACAGRLAGAHYRVGRASMPAEPYRPENKLLNRGQLTAPKHPGRLFNL